MKTLSLSEVKMKLSELVTLVQNTSNEIVITKNGRPAAVLVHPDEYENRKETTEILANKALMAEIMQGLAELKAKGTKLYTLEELFEE